MKTVFITAALLGSVFGQQRQCVYNDAGGSRFQLNLTQIEGWTLERETPDFFFYYTPCRNGLQCQQGNANFANNVAQYKQGANQCVHYLSVDHHEPPEYRFNGASWRFEYEDGEICDVTQQPRRTVIYYICDENVGGPAAYLYNVEEPNPCTYVIEVRSRLACVPESSHNANCQWRVSNGTQGGYYYLDLSSLNTTVLRGYMGNAYVQYLSPCRDGLNCYQQSGGRQVMSTIENRETGTCEHYGASFDDGRNQPMVHNVGQSNEHWSFHYYTGERCSDGTDSFQDIRYFCDADATTPTVLGAYSEGDCRFYMNVSTSAACINQ